MADGAHRPRRTVIAFVTSVVDLIMRDPVIVVMAIILLISTFADQIDRW